MSEIFKHQTFDVLKSWIDAIILEASDELTIWESTFILDMQVRVSNEWTLTKSQHDTLERIYASKTK